MGRTRIQVPIDRETRRVIHCGVPTATDSGQERSAVVLGRIRELELECEQILAELIQRGQAVAAHQMDDAVTGLHKAKSCWNPFIKW